MEDIHKKFIDSLIEAEKSLNNANHFVYVVMPVVKDNKLLLRALEFVNKSAVLVISNILKFEYLYKRVNLTNNPRKNLEVFFSKCALRYGINGEDCSRLNELIKLGKKHKESGVEFARINKVVMVDDDLETNEITLNKIKEFLVVTRKVLDNAKAKFIEKGI